MINIKKRITTNTFRLTRECKHTNIIIPKRNVEQLDNATTKFTRTEQCRNCARYRVVEHIVTEK